MATTMESLNTRIQALELDKASNEAKFQDAATRILGLEADLRLLRQNIADGEKRNRREILESKAIQGLGYMKESREYRAWNLKMRNAFDQARPSYGRKILMWLETVTEKRIDEESEKDETLNVLDVIKEIYKSNTSPRYSGIR